MKHLFFLLAVCAVGLASSEDRSAAYGEFWPSLAEMTPDERANAEIWLEPPLGSVPDAYSEARAISGLWNSGEYEAAIERARGYSHFGDPGEVTVAVSPRCLVECERGFGPDIRIGERDSLYGCSFDRLNNGWLFASFPCRDGNRTYFYSYRSTDNGETWTELASFSWNYADYVRTTTAVCHGNYLVVAIAIRGLWSHRCYTARISTTTGDFVLYPGDSLFTTAFGSPAGDTIVELAAAAAEDEYPGSRIYLFGRTKAGALKFAWTDSSAGTWQVGNTNVTTTCDNGLDCAYNQGFDSKFLWASWLRHGNGDTAWLSYGYWTSEDTLFHSSYFGTVYSVKSSVWIPTAVTLYRDTVQFCFLRRGLSRVLHVYRCDCDSGTWYLDILTDTSVTRDVVEVSGRRGGGFAAAYRNYSGTSDRHLLFRHADRVQGPYTSPDTVSESGHRPDKNSRIRIERLAHGEYGVVWVSWNDTPYHAAYFDRVSLTGIEEPRAPEPVPLGLQALPRPRGVRLAFDNPAAGPVRVRVFDLGGRLRFSCSELMAAGRRAIDVAPEASGVYFAIVEAGGRRLSTRFTFAR